MGHINHSLTTSVYPRIEICLSFSLLYPTTSSFEGNDSMIQETEFIELDIFTDWMCREIQLCLSSFSMKSFHELIMETCIYWNISYVISNELKIIPCYWILLFSCYFISTIAFIITVIWFLLFLFVFVFVSVFENGCSYCSRTYP